MEKKGCKRVFFSVKEKKSRGHIATLREEKIAVNEGISMWRDGRDIASTKGEGKGEVIISKIS